MTPPTFPWIVPGSSPETLPKPPSWKRSKNGISVSRLVEPSTQVTKVFLPKLNAPRAKRSSRS